MPTIRLGHELDPNTLEPSGKPATLDADGLTRHAVCVGMTGSGKTGLCIGLLESLAGAGIPILAIDPKGDLANLALVFDQLTPAAFERWVDPAEAARSGTTVAELAATTAQTWRKGLASEGLTEDDLRAWRSRVAVTVHTPGSEAGVPIDVLTALTTPPSGLKDDPEGLREYVTGAVAALLGLVGRAGDPLTDPASILLSRLLGEAFAEGRPMPLDALIPAVVDPPFDRIGYFPVDEAIPPEQRQQLALELNAVVASPAFAGWLNGVPLDVGAWMAKTPDGRTPLRVLSLAHLDDRQRMFFVTLVLHAVVAWSRRLPGTGALRGLVYFDEVAGYLPPHPKDPPSKAPVMTLMKQARSVGVGVMLCTQNPVDVDYKALSNAGTWLVGRLQTKQDRARVVSGLVAAVGEDEAPQLDEQLGRLPKRAFVWRSAESPRASVLRSKFVMSFLRGPLTRREITSLGQTWERAAAVSDGLLGGPPPLHPEIPRRWLLEPGAKALGITPPPVAPGFQPGKVVWRPALYARFRVKFDEPGWEAERIVHRFLHPLSPDGAGAAVMLEDAWLSHHPPDDDGRYALPPERMDEPAELSRLRVVGGSHRIGGLPAAGRRRRTACAARAGGRGRRGVGSGVGTLHMTPHPTIDPMLDCDRGTSVACTPYATNDRKVGTTVEIGSIGNATTGLDLYRTMIMGGPASQSPRVRVVELDKLTGSTMSGGRSQDLAPPVVGGAALFGSSLLSRDIRECWNVSGSVWQACGEELLVGSVGPSSSTAPGYVSIYEPKPTANSVLYQYVSTIYDPTAATSTSKPISFGTAIAASDPREETSTPWNRGGTYPDWVAISAPTFEASDCAVEIYAVNEGSSTPLTHVQSIEHPAAGTTCAGNLFGQSLAAEDFDHDGIIDLAVGAPGEGTGRVYVFRGTGGSTPLDEIHSPTSPLVLSSGNSGISEFGRTLAAGRFLAGYQDRAALVVGVPGWVKSGLANVGGVCTFALDGVTNGSTVVAQDCFLNDLLGWTSGDRFGDALAVGNFANIDGNGEPSTPEARIKEVAIGAPGYGGGAVAVYLTGNTSIRVADLATFIASPSPFGSSDGFGQSIAAGYVQNNDWADLAIGAPLYNTNDGGAALTQAGDVYFACPGGAVGIWTAEDIDSVDVPIRIAEQGDGTMRLTFLEAFHSQLVDSTSAVCELDGDDVDFWLDAGTTLVLDPAWSCTAGSPQTWDDVDGSAVATAVLAANGIGPATSAPVISAIGGAPLDIEMATGSGTGTIDLTLDIGGGGWTFIDAATTVAVGDTLDHSCTMEPFVITLVSENVCE